MVDCRPSVCLIYVIFERISHIHHIFISFRGNSFAKFALLRLFFTNHRLITTFFLLNSGVSIVSEHLHNLCNNSWESLSRQLSFQILYYRCATVSPDVEKHRVYVLRELRHRYRDVFFSCWPCAWIEYSILLLWLGVFKYINQFHCPGWGDLND